MKYYFTADEHFFHANIIKYCKRPFKNLKEMHNTIISNHNEVVGKKDGVIHAGDFSFGSLQRTQEIIDSLNGVHIFLTGSHDRWQNKVYSYIYEKNLQGTYVVACHYPMRTWPRSHYGSIQLHGHSHGKLEPLENQYDIGVDNNDFYPVYLEDIKEKINER